MNFLPPVNPIQAQKTTQRRNLTQTVAQTKPCKENPLLRHYQKCLSVFNITL